MPYKLTVKEHLRNDSLYQPLFEPSYDNEWKRRLLNHYAIHKQFKDTLNSRTSTLKVGACIVVPVVCLFLVFASYFGLLHLGPWFESIILKAALNVPVIGLKEVLVFAAVVNSLTFLFMKQKFSF